MLVAGVDVGSTTTKAVILDENKNMIAAGIVSTGANVARAAERAFKEALEKGNLEDYEVEYVVGTGYGRYRVSFGDVQITEIGCHAKGACYLFPQTRTILDIGGQDTKAIKVNGEAEVLDFCMNDKCAAGTGRFLDAASQVMGLELAQIGEVALQSRRPLKITNVCTVFVESEIVSHLARGREIEDILAGVHQSIAARSVALLRRVGIEQEITFTGGVAKNIGMVRALEERLNISINVCPHSQFMGAIGAGLFALERAKTHDGNRRRSS